MNKRTLYAFLISFLLLITAIIVNQKSFDSMRRYTSSVTHSREIITSLERLLNDFKSAQIFTPIYTEVEHREFNRLYLEEAKNVFFEIMRLENLTIRDPVQSNRIDTISARILDQYNVLLNKSIFQIIQSGESWRLKKLYDIHVLINDCIVYEQNSLIKLDAELKASTRTANLITWLFSAIAIAIIILTFIFNVILARKGKWLEGFLESILNTSQNAVVHYKAERKHGKIVDFRVEFANLATEKHFKIKLDAIVGKKLSEIDSYVLESDLFGKYVSVVETGTQLEFEELYRRGETETWFYMMLGKLGDGITASFHDITHVKKYETELKNNIARLEHSNDELEQYAYIASHDLQEPLRKIRTYGSYLQNQQSGRLSDSGQKHLEKMVDAAERMSRLISDILGFSSLKREQKFLETDLDRILDNVINDLDLLIQEKKGQSDSSRYSSDH